MENRTKHIIILLFIVINLHKFLCFVVVWRKFNLSIYIHNSFYAFKCMPLKTNTNKAFIFKEKMQCFVLTLKQCRKAAFEKLIV